MFSDATSPFTKSVHDELLYAQLQRQKELVHNNNTGVWMNGPKTDNSQGRDDLHTSALKDMVIHGFSSYYFPKHWSLRTNFCWSNGRRFAHLFNKGRNGKTGNHCLTIESLQSLVISTPEWCSVVLLVCTLSNPLFAGIKHLRCFYTKQVIKGPPGTRLKMTKECCGIKGKHYGKHQHYQL